MFPLKMSKIPFYTDNLLLLFGCFCVYALCIAKTAKADVSQSTEAFTVHNIKLPTAQWIEVPNHYLPSTSSSVKMSLTGTSVLTIDEKNSTSWTISLADRSVIQLSAIKSDFKVTEYRFLWPGGQSNVNREVCFHHGFRNAFW